jgi:hypothetical protein
MAKPAQARAVRRRKRGAGDAIELSRRDIEEHGA